MLRDLVPGDRIELEAGDNIPADARVTQAFALQVQESALTGESMPVQKDAAVVLPAETAVGDRQNMVYLGTIAVAGKASAIVVATGMQTELGHIAGMLQRDEPEKTPLQRRLAELGRVLIVVCLLMVAIIFLLQMLRGEECAGGVSSIGESGGGRRARGTSGGRHDGSRAGFTADGAAERLDSQTSQRRNARLGDGDLFGQNGDADTQ